MKSWQFLDKKLIRFILVGIVNTLVGSGIMFLLYNCLSIGYWISTACNYIFGGIVSFVLNKYFTFDNHKKAFIQILFFILNLLVCYFLAYIIAKKAIYFLLSSQTEKIRDNISMLVGMCIYTILNYFGQRFIVFADKDKEVENE